MNKLTTLLSKESLSKVEKYVTLFIYYILPVIVLITLISAMANSNNVGFSRQEIWRNLGRKLLSIVLFIKPITFLGKKYLKAEEISLEYVVLTLKDLPKTIKIHQKEITGEVLPKYIFPFIRDCIYSISLYLMKFRRQLGIASFWGVFTHGMLWEIFRVRQDFSLFFNIGNTAIWTGIIALIALLIGAWTSNNYAMQKLQKNRKKVQMIAYIAFFFGAIHTGNTFWLIIYFGVKYFERRDTGQLTIRKEWGKNQWNTIIFHPQVSKYIKIIKNNKKITQIVDKICKK